MAKHTPGPWKRCAANDGRCPCAQVWSRTADVIVAQAVGPRDIERYGNPVADEEELHANLCLIEAAPDLLAAALAALKDPGVTFSGEGVHTFIALAKATMKAIGQAPDDSPESDTGPFPKKATTVATPETATPSSDTDNKITLKDWTVKNTVEVWQDDDGDIGLVDRRGYSIILHHDEADKLYEWLGNLLARRQDV
jgi:hypothetical protein